MGAVLCGEDGEFDGVQVNYLIQEIEASQKRARGYEQVIAALAHHVDKLEVELNNARYDLDHAEYERDEAYRLLAEIPVTETNEAWILKSQT